MNPTNTFFIGNGGIVQLDDVLISMAGNARKSSGGDKPEPGPEPEPEDPKLKEEKYFASLEIPASTLRFSFGDLNYDPTKDETVASRHNTAERAGGGTAAGYGGTWTKLETEYTNIWDYTYLGNTLLNEWDNGNLSAEDPPATRFWNDVDNNPIKIIATNTAGCTSFKRAFQGCWAITEIWNLDMSDSTSAYVTFSYLKNLKKLCLIDLSKTTDCRYMIQHCFNLEEIEGVVLPDDDSSSTLFDGAFMLCTSLKRIGGTLNMKSISALTASFAGCTELAEVTLTNTGTITSFDYAFTSCRKLPWSFITSIDTHSATSLMVMFGGKFGQALTQYTTDVVMENIRAIPLLDLSSAKDCRYMYQQCDIQEMDVSRLSSMPVTAKINYMLARNRNCHAGILSAYEALSGRMTGSHTGCFEDTGVDNEYGLAELQQVPASWGGLKEEG